MAESRIEMQTVKWTVEGMVKGVCECRVFHDVTHTLVVRDMFVSCKEYGLRLVNQGGTADYDIRPW